MAGQLEILLKIIASAEDVNDMRRRTGAPRHSPRKRRRTCPGKLLGAPPSPRGCPLAGRLAAHHGGIGLVDAVAASCAGGGLPYRIGDNPYLDGGYRANAESADLAVGHERRLVLSPLAGRTVHPPHWRTAVAAQVAELRTHGSNVETIIPDSSGEHMFGANAMNMSLRPLAEQAGYKQGTMLAEQLSDFWN